MSTYRFIAAERDRFPVRMSCRHLGVSQSSFYDWCSRPPSRREVDDRALTKLIREIHEGSRGTYGLRESGIVASMRAVGTAYDNAAAESFFSTLKRELINPRRFATRAEAKSAIFE